jgi:predicted extracellular nuclease
VINNHFSSRFGSTPIFGGPQPFVQAGEIERGEQARANNEVAKSILAEDPNAAVMVVGDLNTFQFTDELAEVLSADGDLTNLLSELGAEDRDDKYTFNFEGNSQMLDHMFVSRRLSRSAPKYDIVHVNVDYPRVDASVGSDHEPLLARFTLR